MPSQLVNDRAIDAIVGPQMRARSSSTGMPSRMLSVRMSREVSFRIRRRERRPPEREGVARGAAGSVCVAGIVTTTLSLRREDRLLLRLDVLGNRVHVVRVGQELLDGRDHYSLREVRPRVAVHELRNVFGTGDQVHRLLLADV